MTLSTARSEEQEAPHSDRGPSEGRDGSRQPPHITVTVFPKHDGVGAHGRSGPLGAADDRDDSHTELTSGQLKFAPSEVEAKLKVRKHGWERPLELNQVLAL